MAFWSSETLRKRLPSYIDPFDNGSIYYAGYELCLGCETVITGSKRGRAATQHWHPGQKPVIAPGQFALLITDETVQVPPDAIAFISIKASKKLQGLVNVSGFHVDPGFKGKLLFSVYNASSRDVVLEICAPTFIIWYCTLDKVMPKQDLYNGVHKNQDKLTAKHAELLRGDMHAPQVLGQKLERLNTRVNIMTSLFVALLAALVVAAIAILAK